MLFSCEDVGPITISILAMYGRTAFFSRSGSELYHNFQGAVRNNSGHMGAKIEHLEGQVE